MLVDQPEQVPATAPPRSGDIGRGDTPVGPYRFILLIVTWAIPALVALGVGLWGLTAVGIDRDETATIDIGTRTVPEIFRTISRADAVHALYYLFMHFWMGWFGTSPATIRMPSLLGAVLAAGLLAVLGTRLVSRRAGITAGLLYACAPMISAYAHDARSYGIVSMLVICLTLAMVRAMTSPRRRTWIPYGALLLLVVTLHLFMLLIVAAHAVTIGWYALSRRDWRPARRWLGTVVLALIPLTLLLSCAIAQGATANWITAPTWPTVGTMLVDLSGGFALIGPMFILAVFAYRRRTTGNAVPSVFTIALPWLILPPTLLLTVSLWDPLYVFRYVLYCLPALMLLVATALDRLDWRLHVPVLVTLIAVAIPLQIAVRSPDIGANDLRGEAVYLQANKEPGDSIVYLIPTQRYMASSYPAAYAGLRDLAVDQTQAQAANFSGTDVSDRTLLQRLRTVDRVWAVKYWAFTWARPHNAVVEQDRYALFREAGLKWVSTTHFRGGAILLFVRKVRVPPEASVPLNRGS